MHSLAFAFPPISPDGSVEAPTFDRVVVGVGMRLHVIRHFCEISSQADGMRFRRLIIIPACRTSKSRPRRLARCLPRPPQLRDRSVSWAFLATLERVMGRTAARPSRTPWEPAGLRRRQRHGLGACIGVVRGGGAVCLTSSTRPAGRLRSSRYTTSASAARWPTAQWADISAGAEAFDDARATLASLAATRLQNLEAARQEVRGATSLHFSSLSL